MTHTCGGLHFCTCRAARPRSRRRHRQSTRPDPGARRMRSFRTWRSAPGPRRSSRSRRCSRRSSARPRDAAARRLPDPAHLAGAARDARPARRRPHRARGATRRSRSVFEAGADDFVRKPVQAGGARRAHPRAAPHPRVRRRAREEGAGRAPRPRAHAGPRVEPRLPRHPLHGRPAHRRGRAGSTA